ncbi:MAG TPA: transcription-repair coupling factor [Pseudogracilibacillus sp.]|nr:transcription-repair coupling factor [Pseudogracilibacillus sp.]
MEGLYEYLKNDADIKKIMTGLEKGYNEQLVTGLTGPSRSLYTSIIQKKSNKQMLIVTNQLSQAQQLYDDLTEYINESFIYLYPVNELITSEVAIASPEMRSERMTTLSAILNGDAKIIIAPIAGLKRILPPKELWEKYQLTFAQGESIDLTTYLQTFTDMGYKRVQMVTTPGEFSIRGGIIDIYPMTEKYPVRIELFDDEIDSIRYFNADSQRSLEQVNQITINPAEEMLLTEEHLLSAGQQLDKLFNQTMSSLKTKVAKEKLLESVGHDLERLKSGEKFSGIAIYNAYFYEQPANLLDYLNNDAIIVLDEMSRIQESANQLDLEEGEWYSHSLEMNHLMSQMNFSYDYSSIRKKMSHQKIYLSVFMRHIPNTKPEQIINISTRTMQEFHGQMPLFKGELTRWSKANYSVIVFVENEQRAKKVQSILNDYEIELPIVEKVKLPLNQQVISIGNLNKGIELPTSKLAIITENELFKKKKRQIRKQHNITNAERIKNYQELNIGDYVVHRNHGVGKYVGVETLVVKGNHKDYMLIQYSGDDRLYVPIDQIDLVQKFVGSEGKQPRLYKLGGTEWSKVKQKVQTSVEDIADDLIELYAERQARKGYAYDQDSELQIDFEASFPYEETPDQLTSIEEIKKDMEKERPMDRLLCGDVGYGKTEVAIRAAFKAISEGKQVALLVPTTILAQQHYQTVTERFQDYPIEVALLSRFRTKKQQNETIAKLKTGGVDIVIGTHRLLSKDLVYKDLGLLIVDEEQRFGVKHKEKIKEIKTNVDVLTLTATPIPRTLHMSMLGIRDLSVIETPPENRFPVQTYVVERSPLFIKEAIERELGRGGQVFLLYNRIENIEKIAQEINELVDGVRIAIAHGRMNETELENVMLGFLEGEYDVLVSTTIIETGVDIPNVNTLIVYDADRMGLSQLYQLRGRVGRSNRVAYAYFTYQKDKVLNEVAEKRLQAIKEFTELGSGFKIAMRDLSIRGAGNLLGAAQHGFIDSVGFDLYSQMLKEAIEAKKLGKEVEAVQPFNPELNLIVDAYIPDSYIEDEQQKIDMYKRFQTLSSEEAITDLQDELIDRFGDYPDEVEHLFLVSKLRMLAKEERVESIKETEKKIELLVTNERSKDIDGTKLFELANHFGRSVRLGTANNQLKVIFTFRKTEKPTTRYEQLSKFIKEMTHVNRTEVIETSQA